MATPHLVSTHVAVGSLSQFPLRSIRTRAAYTVGWWHLGNCTPPAPGWLLRLVAPPSLPPLPESPTRPPDAPGGRRRYALAALRHASDRAASAPQGRRNDTLNAETFSLTRFMADGALAAEEIASAMAYAARQAGLLPHEVKGTLTSALAAGMRR